MPVRTTQMNGSVPLWAGGAAVEKTLGPFLSKDGRQYGSTFSRSPDWWRYTFRDGPIRSILFNVPLAKQFSKTTCRRSSMR